MGCRASKVVDDLTLVKRCKERKRLMKNAVDNRYELSNSHVAYFHSLKDMGHALSRFVDQQLDIPPSSSPDDDDALLPPSGSDSDLSSDFHGHDNNGHIRRHDDDDDGDDDDDNDDDDGGGGGGGGFEHKPQLGLSLSNKPQEQMDMNDPYLIKREIPMGPEHTNYYWSDQFLNSRGPMLPYDQPVLPYQQQPPWGLSGWGGGDDDPYVLQYQPPPAPWGMYDFFFNYNDGYNNISNGYPVSNLYSNQYATANYLKKSAPATRTTVIQPEETRGWVDDAYVDESMRAEGIPDELEEELTESESHSTKTISLGHEQNSSWTSTTEAEGSTSIRIPAGKRQHSMDDEGKKGKSLDIDDEGYSTTQKIELSAHASRDLHEVFKEIKDEFETAFSYGKQVALMLEAGKLPYQSRFHVLKVILSNILGPLAPSSTSSSSRSRVTELAGSYNVYDVPDNRSLNLSSTLEKLYMWEKKLYKEVKDAERFRVMYQRMLKRLTELEPCRANSNKIHAAQASIARLRTKLDISMKLIDAISSEIRQVRDMKLQPQVSMLIYRLIRMWQSIGKCHRKQLEAIMESRILTLRANTSMERDSSLGTTLELKTGLVTWAQHFNSWIYAQKSFVDSLNGWLLQFIDHEPEITTDGGEVPYSPGRSGDPPIFIIFNDWQRQLNGVSQERVSIAMNKFALKLRQLLEREDEIQRLSESQVDLDHKKAMKLVKNVGTGSLQDGVIPIFKALEKFSRDVLKAHKHVRLQ